MGLLGEGGLGWFWPRDGMMRPAVSSSLAGFGNSLVRTPIIQSAGHLVRRDGDDICVLLCSTGRPNDCGTPRPTAGLW